ncbi:hypothetical protein [Flavobacterium sp. N3904]|uniref:hypothetical protein n=1 Tax=Flavobacterium sp. N3904 TaxID=2986835 RepID=UPI00222483E2|nr:hypothetical protein [Flavobacterium sp. N3904]
MRNNIFTTYKRFFLGLFISILSIGFTNTLHASTPTIAEEISGKIQLAKKPVAKATVQFFATSEGAPKLLSETKTDDKGFFKLNAKKAENSTAYYIVAKATDNTVTLVLLLSSDIPKEVTINELTTVASSFTAARFINGESISGKALGLKIAAGNVPNLVDPVTGNWGKVLLDPLNSTQTTTLANINTLGSLISAYGTIASSDWKTRFLQASNTTAGTTPKSTFEAMAGIAKAPWVNSNTLFGLFNEVYPQPADGSRRSAPFIPYLAYTPDDFTLSLCFAGGGMCANGRFMFDAEGNLWSGQNWMPGSQSGVVNSIGGGVIKMTPNGTALSPAITGFTGMGLDGVGWGTAVTNDNVWATSFNGKILVMDFNGNPIGDESIFPFKEKLKGLMGIGVATNGDVWVADGSNNQLLYFPGGKPKDGRIVKVAGLSSPFDIVIDPQNYVWVSNSQSDKLIRFPANDPTKTQTFTCGLSVRALALDSKGNVWVVSNMSLDFPVPKVPEGASIMEQFEILGGAMLTYPKSTGLVHMITPDGVMAAPAGYDGGGQIDVPWGVNIDGNDDVWVGNLGPRTRSVVLMAGNNTQGHPAGTKPGDVIHSFTGGSIQMLTDVAIDPAGNVWAANNWNDAIAATSKDPKRSISTWGGGSGLTIIYGVAAPVKSPRIGIVRKP